MPDADLLHRNGKDPQILSAYKDLKTWSCKSHAISEEIRYRNATQMLAGKGRLMVADDQTSSRYIQVDEYRYELASSITRCQVLYKSPRLAMVSRL